MSRRELLQQRVIQAFVLVVLPILPGCLFPFAVPKVSQTPLLNLGPEADQIHAFRVDGTLDFVDIGGIDHLTFSQITSISGWLLPRTKFSSTYGIYLYQGPFSYPFYISHSLGLKLYRPGYELVEIDSWEQPGKIVWNEAPDLASQEKVLDQLFLMKAKNNENELTWNDRCLSAGSESPEHQRVLLFGASEYERLASLVVDSNSEGKTFRARLEAKAAQLRELARKTEPSPSLAR